MSTVKPLDDFFLQQQEPCKSCLDFLRAHILQFDKNITEKLQFGAPHFFYKERRFCYFWINKKLKHPYIGIIDGKLIDYPGLVQGNRTRMKVMLIDPTKDISVRKINGLLKKVLNLYK